MNPERKEGLRIAGLDPEATAKGNDVTEKIIGCAIRAHQELGPGLLEIHYLKALCIEFEEAGLRHHREVTVPVLYRGRTIGKHRVDLIVEDLIVVELKAVERMEPPFDAQVIAYLRLTGKRVGLLINFNSALVKSGVRRFVL